LLVVLLVVVLAWRTSADKDAEGRRALELQRAGQQAQVAARRAVIAMTTYDYRTLGRDFAWVHSAGTASFQRHYAQVSRPIKTLVARLHATAKGHVVASAATARDPDHVTVLLFVDQTLTNASAGGARQLDQPRVTMAMVRSHGRWLVDDVELGTLTGR
jgi:Mce-associated membrane protein